MVGSGVRYGYAGAKKAMVALRPGRGRRLSQEHRLRKQNLSTFSTGYVDNSLLKRTDKIEVKNAEMHLLVTRHPVIGRMMFTRAA